MKRLLLLAAVVLALGVDQAQAAPTLTAKQARTKIGAAEPRAEIKHCHRLSPRHVQCHVLIVGTYGYWEELDEEGNVIERVPAEAMVPSTAVVGLKGVRWYEV